MSESAEASWKEQRLRNTLKIPAGRQGSHCKWDEEIRKGKDGGKSGERHCGFVNRAWGLELDILEFVLLRTLTSQVPTSVPPLGNGENISLTEGL